MSPGCARGGLARLSYGFVRDAAGVDDGYVGAEVVRPLLVALPEQTLTDLMSIGVRDLAAQKTNGKGRHRPRMLLGPCRGDRLNRFEEIGGPAVARGSADMPPARE